VPPGCLSQYRFVGGPQGDVPMPEDWSFVIASSGVHADRPDRCATTTTAPRWPPALLQCWNDAAAPAPSLGGAGPGGALQLYELVRRPPDGYTTDALVKRLPPLAEDERVPDAARVRLADARAGIPFRDSQRGGQYRQQIPETCAGRRRVRLRCHRGQRFGAGFGGSVWALVPSTDARAFAAAWLAGYRRRCPARATSSGSRGPGRR
jgi:galactokinase